MSQDQKMLCEFFRSIVKGLRERLSPAEFNELIAESAPENDGERTGHQQGSG